MTRKATSTTAVAEPTIADDETTTPDEALAAADEAVAPEPAAPAKPKITSATISRRYRLGLDWIAAQDEPTILDPEVVAEQLTVTMLAELFAVDPSVVAGDVISRRS